MSGSFTTPYAFVPTDWNHPPLRQAPLWHNQFPGNALSGKMEFSLEAVTHLYIKAEGVDRYTPGPWDFYHLKKEEQKIYHIPSTTLKGLIRGIAETIGNGCYCRTYLNGFKKGQYTREEELPPIFQSCKKNNQLCITCRLFGMIGDKKNHNVYRGNLHFSDAFLFPGNANRLEPVKILRQYRPDTRKGRLYFQNNKISGRKYYFHHHHAEVNPRAGQWDQARAFPPGTTFRFSLAFDKLLPGEFDLLLYALLLEPEMRHKMGYGKAYGYGSVKIRCTELILSAGIDRYRGASEKVYEDQELKKYIDQHLQEWKKTAPAPGALEELRKIWSIQIPRGVNYGYDVEAFRKSYRGGQKGRGPSSRKYGEGGEMSFDF